MSCEIEMVGPEITACCQGSSFLSDAVAQGMFIDKPRDDSTALKWPLVTMDNSLSPSHTLLQLVCQDHKGLLYDVMRTLKDYNIQVNSFTVQISAA